jgi:hypothetical protein
MPKPRLLNPYLYTFSLMKIHRLLSSLQRRNIFQLEIKETTDTVSTASFLDFDDKL